MTTGPMVRAGVLALALAVALPAAVVAAGREGGGGGARGGGEARPPAPAVRAAPVTRPPAPPPTAVKPQPVRPGAPAGGGFNFNRDTAGPPQRVAPQVPQRVAPQVPQRQRPIAEPARPVAAPPRANEPGQRTIPPYRRPPNTAGNGPHSGQFHGPVIANPHHFNGSWGWNHGVAWRPAPTYWGGGFWGPWALGALAGAALFGAIVDENAQVQYPSYQVEPDSPGAQALQSYGLQQTACGPPNLVDIWGPDNSVVCALPNDTVAPGEYELDPETLNLIPASP